MAGVGAGRAKTPDGLGPALREGKAMSEEARREEERRRIEEEVARLKAERAEMEARIRELERKLREASAREEVGEPITSDVQLEQTLRRLMHRTAMILQAEKSVFMLYDPESGELVAQKPAVGLDDEQLRHFRVRATHGVSGEAFRENKPIIVDDAINDPRTVQEMVALLNVRNAVTVPLTVEEKDEEQRVVNRRTIGVLHVFNKRRGQRFTDEDVRLLVIMAKQAAAVIRNATVYLQLLGERDQLAATLQSLMAGVVVVDTHKKVLLLNAAARRIFAIPEREEVVGHPYSEVVREEKVQNLIERVLEHHREVAEEITLYLPEERVYQVQVAPIYTEQKELTGVVTALNDITEIRNVERMKSAFISRLSHELTTPLTAIKGFVSTLLEDEESGNGELYDRATRLEFYRIIGSECNRLERLINDLLNVSRIEHGMEIELDFRSVDVPEVLRRVVQVYEATSPRHRFKVTVEPQIPPIMADAPSVEVIFNNLISNAVKYSPKGGLVEVTVRHAPEGVEISVADQGVGIPPDKIPRIFERFERLSGPEREQTGGVGIGLFLVKHLVEAHGGRIWVQSEVGRGSTFYVFLPQTPPAVGRRSR